MTRDWMKSDTRAVLVLKATKGIGHRCEKYGIFELLADTVLFHGDGEPNAGHTLSKGN